MNFKEDCHQACFSIKTKGHMPAVIVLLTSSSLFPSLPYDKSIAFSETRSSQNQ